MPIDRCYCRHVFFEDLWKIAERTGEGLTQLGEQTGCGTACGLCVPYLRVMLATGRTELPVLSPEIENLCSGSGRVPGEHRGGDGVSKHSP